MGHNQTQATPLLGSVCQASSQWRRSCKGTLSLERVGEQLWFLVEVAVGVGSGLQEAGQTLEGTLWWKPAVW